MTSDFQNRRPWHPPATCSASPNQWLQSN